MTPVDLQAILPWFDDRETRRWLGDRAWPAQALRLASRDARRQALVIEVDGASAGLIDADPEDDGSVGVALVIAPELRRRGIAVAAVRCLTTGSLFPDASRFVAGVERGNAASERLMRAAGFLPVGEHDEDGFQTFVLTRS